MEQEQEQKKKHVDQQWEKDTLERLLFDTLKEQRAKRRWGAAIKLLTLLFAAAVTAHAIFTGGDENEPTGKHTAVIEVTGVIDPNQNSASRSLIPALNKAFANRDAAGIVLRINSPGGSPVQAGMVSDEIKRLKEKYPDKRLHVAVHDICASGAYYIAAAADKVYVDKASIVGSIGVLMSGFGYTGTMQKLGVERRLMIAGEHKGFMDSFSPQSEAHREHAQKMLNEIHQQFIDTVKKGRGNKLKESPEIFSGLFWSGAKAVEMGLADGFGTERTIARNDFKAERLVDYTIRGSLTDRLIKRFSASLAESLVSSAASTLVSAGSPQFVQ